MGGTRSGQAMAGVRDMNKKYGDMYALFRHEPRAEEYFNALPGHIQDRISAQYQAVDSMERLEGLAHKAGAGTVEGWSGGYGLIPPYRDWF